MHEMRNFCIIAHIDHGKSTLADRMLELTNSVSKVDGGQMLDTMDLEQERGITIKLTPARMQWQWVELNLIDTPGHVDFQYEVSRSLAAVEGAVLLVDASQGIQAQTLSTLYMAIENDLTIIPVLNKIDLPAADPERVTKELEQAIGIDADEVLCISAKTGQWVEAVLDAIVERIESPAVFKHERKEKFWRKDMEITGELPSARALIFDSVFDQYKWVVAYVKVVDGKLEEGKPVALGHSEVQIRPTEVGYFTPAYAKDTSLQEWQIGYVVTGQKSVRDAKIGDTMMTLGNAALKDPTSWSQWAIPGFEKVKPFVFAGVYPIETEQYERLKEAFEKLSLNDSAIEFEYEQSQAMGHGFRCGFLGTLHMDIIKERLSREYGMETIFTTPTVRYIAKLKYLKDQRITSGMNIKELIKNGLWKWVMVLEEWANMHELALEEESTPPDELATKYEAVLKPWLSVRSGADMPDQGMVEEIYEPLVDVEVVGPEEWSGNIMGLAQEYRGQMHGMEYLDEQRVVWKYLMPMGEIIVDFYDRLKSATKGYATMNYEFKRYEAADLVRLDIYINSERVEAFSLIVHKEKAYGTGRNIVEKLKDLIPRHMFKVPIQAGIGSKMIARETIPAIRKDVTAKCYGGDVSRKRKLLKKQKEGKKKMKSMGKVSVPGDIFLKMVSR